MYILHTWNSNDPCFGWKRPSFEGFNPQNKGQIHSQKLTQLLKIGLPKRKCHLPTIHFQGRTVSFKELPGMYIIYNIRRPYTFGEID